MSVGRIRPTEALLSTDGCAGIDTLDRNWSGQATNNEVAVPARCNTSMRRFSHAPSHRHVSAFQGDTAFITQASAINVRGLMCSMCCQGWGCNIVFSVSPLLHRVPGLVASVDVLSTVKKDCCCQDGAHKSADPTFHVHRRTWMLQLVYSRQHIFTCD